MMIAAPVFRFSRNLSSIDPGALSCLLLLVLLLGLHIGYEVSLSVNKMKRAILKRTVSWKSV